MKTFRVYFLEKSEMGRDVGITTLQMNEKSEKELRVRLRGIPIHHVEEIDPKPNRWKKGDLTSSNTKPLGDA